MDKSGSICYCRGSIAEKKLRYGLSIECAPLSDSEQDQVVCRSRRMTDSSGYNSIIRISETRLIEFLTQDVAGQFLTRNWENDQHYDGKRLTFGARILLSQITQAPTKKSPRSYVSRNFTLQTRNFSGSSSEVPTGVTAGSQSFHSA